MAEGRIQIKFTEAGADDVKRQVDAVADSVRKANASVSQASTQASPAAKQIDTLAAAYRNLTTAAQQAQAQTSIRIPAPAVSVVPVGGIVSGGAARAGLGVVARNTQEVGMVTRNFGGELRAASGALGMLSMSLMGAVGGLRGGAALLGRLSMLSGFASAGGVVGALGLGGLAIGVGAGTFGLGEWLVNKLFGDEMDPEELARLREKRDSKVEREVSLGKRLRDISRIDDLGTAKSERQKVLDEVEDLQQYRDKGLWNTERDEPKLHNLWKELDALTAKASELTRAEELRVAQERVAAGDAAKAKISAIDAARAIDAAISGKDYSAALNLLEKERRQVEIDEEAARFGLSHMDDPGATAEGIAKTTKKLEESVQRIVSIDAKSKLLKDAMDAEISAREELNKRLSDSQFEKSLSQQPLNVQLATWAAKANEAEARFLEAAAGNGTVEEQRAAYNDLTNAQAKLDAVEAKIAEGNIKWADTVTSDSLRRVGGYMSSAADPYANAAQSTATNTQRANQLLRQQNTLLTKIASNTQASVSVSTSTAVFA